MLDPKNLGKGEEQYEFFTRRQGGRTKKYCQYDYRDSHGELFSTVRPTLESCRKERDIWLNRETC